MRIKNEHPVFIITGPIACGKSTFSKMLGQYFGATYINADTIGHDVLIELSELVVSKFGSQILNKNGIIDRKKLGSIVFADKEKLLILETILHPIINKKVETIILNTKNIIVFEVVLLEKTNYKNIDNTIVVYVDSPYENIVQRIIDRGFNKTEAIKRIESQSEIKYLKNKSEIIDIIIENNSTLESLKDKAYQLSKDYMK